MIVTNVTWASTLGLALLPNAWACIVPPAHHMKARSVNEAENRKRSAGPPLEIETNQNNITHWTVEENTRQMQVTDDAFNARDFSRFNHHPNIIVYNPGNEVQDLQEHFDGIESTYANTDLILHNHDYKIMFGEGDWTVAVETVNGIQNGPQQNLAGSFIAPTNKEVSYDLMTIACWNNGWMMEEYIWPDSVLMYRQIGILPSPPVGQLPDLELNAATPLSTGNNSSPQANKEAMKQVDAAINEGDLSAATLKLAPHAQIYGLTDAPLDPQGYIKWVTDFKTAFPDFMIDNQPYRQIVSQGDWTATAANITGTHSGNLVMPPYLSEKPISATGKSFELIHYTIARWQDGEIVGLRVNLDMFGLVGALGIQLT